MCKLLLMYIFTLSLGSFISLAQEDTSRVATKEEVSELKGSLDGMNETVLEMKSTLDALKKIKVSGYVQAQYQVAETTGVLGFITTPSQIANYAGGAMQVNVRSRFLVRRGRIKFNYDSDLTQYVLQLDVTQSGVAIKDAYASIRDPWIRTVGLTAGIFDRPFGFEISYSSGNRESPERSRVYQTLFPGEREVGAKLEVMAEDGPLSYFNLKAGLFNGVLNNANENDRNKDFIGRIGFQAPLEEQNLSIDGGFSIYDGKVTSNSIFVYYNDPASPGKNFLVDSAATNLNGSYGRAYYGGDLQIYYDLPIIGGLSLRGEYITGQQPGTALSNSFYNTLLPLPIYMRNFRGWYVNYIQNIGVSHQIVVKYDVLDPNTDVEGGDIGAPGSNLQLVDVKYSTLGFGWVYHWDANVKFTFYYDMVKNESVNAAATGLLSQLTEDVDDNVFTVRMQYKF